ncbi:MAG: hypothetical protein QOJ15_2945 [Bradyrhizobium sp.]|nr:hypothetical protein [Bradyrhizobium sp.]
MLPDNSFLRRLPAILDPVGRIRVEALVFSSDVLTHAYLSLRELAARVGDTDHSFRPQDRVALFSYAWTIVDQLHVLRQLIRAMTNDTPGPNQAKFLELSESATLMRNRMDHLSGLVKNLSVQKGPRAPLFGALTYFLVEPKHMQAASNPAIVVGGSFVTITSGSVPEGKALFQLGNPMSRPIRPPVSQFILTAFDWSLDIDAALEALEVTITRTAANVEQSIIQQCEAENARSGAEMATLLKPQPVGDFILVADIEFQEPSSD